MELMWFALGAVAVGIVWSLQVWMTKKQPVLSWGSWAGIVTEVFLVLFTLAWVISSIEEGENQAAGMGLLVIGGCSLVVFALTRKQVIKDMAVASQG